MVRLQVEQILQSCGVEKEKPILVALSGGADSMALLHILLKLGYSFHTAHCNFHLRGEESDEDERFVFDFCLENKVPLHVTHFDTYSEADRDGISIEMAARNLRYKWFRHIMHENNLSWLATGHHGDDMIETFFLNLARGTGLRGLKGMNCCKGNIVRPLLHFSRADIEAYCAQNHIPFRTDSSNTDTAFYRNNIRHNIIPVMNELNPSFFDTMMQNFHNLEEVWQIFEKEVDSVREQMVAEEGDMMLIPVKSIRGHPQRKSILFELLRPYNFNSVVVSEVIESLEGIPGKQFFSKTHRLVRDRYNLVLVPLAENEGDEFYLQNGDKHLEIPFEMTIRVFDRDEDFSISRDSNQIHLDADLVEFPLKIRHWRRGDQFRPLGMEQFKKLSDYFVDEKFSRVEKDRTWLLVSGDNDIVWVVGHRIDDRFKVTPSTQRILELTLDGSFQA
ncbi:MAG: tRNA lysidine(34) synthetase TilS [Marinilabiliaceae bacterium]